MNHIIKSDMLARYFGGWISVLLIVSIGSRFYLDEGSNRMLVLQMMALSWPLLVIMFVPSSPKLNILLESTTLVRFILAYVVTGLSSLFISPKPLQSIEYLGSIILGFLLVHIFSASMSNDDIVKGLKLYSLIGAITLVIYSVAVGLDFKSRLSSDILSANSIGIMSVSVIMAALLNKTVWMKLVTGIPSFIVLLIANSRTCIVALFIGLFIWFLLKKRSNPNSLQVAIMFFMLTALIIVLWGQNQKIIDVASNIFALNDDYRGVSSGATGRTDAWSEAWSIFMSSPIVGVGYRMHEYFMREFSSAHNGYLALLADNGIVGAVPVLWLIGSALRNYWKHISDELVPWKIGLVCSYLAIGVFERFLINIGNPTSILVLMLLVRGITCYSSDDTYRAREIAW